MAWLSSHRGAVFGALLLLTYGWAAAPRAAEAWSLHDAVGAPEALTLSGSARIRFEAIEGQARPGFSSREDLVALRTTLFAEYRSGPIRFGGELYDSRVFGADRGGVISTSDVNALEPVQAYVAADLGKRVSVQAGRMMLNLGTRRLVAADDYRNTTNGYTGLRLDARTDRGDSLVLIYTAPQERLPETAAALRKAKVRLDRESDDLLLWGGVATRALPGKATLSLEYIGLDERDRPDLATRNRNLHSFGLAFTRPAQPGRIDYDVEAIRQVGTVRASLAADAPVLDVSAGFIHAELGYQFAARWKPRLALEYDWASGDRGAGRYNRFDTLFGTRRVDYAPSGLFNALNRINFSTPGVRIEAQPTARLDGFVHYQGLWLASKTDSFATTNVRDASGRSGSFAGHLLEARARYWLVERSLRAEVNAVLLAKGRFLETAPNAPRNGDTAYLSVGLTATF